MEKKVNKKNEKKYKSDYSICSQINIFFVFLSKITSITTKKAQFFLNLIEFVFAVVGMLVIEKGGLNK